jgi:hypothetical protein
MRASKVHPCTFSSTHTSDLNLMHALPGWATDAESMTLVMPCVCFAISDMLWIDTMISCNLVPPKVISFDLSAAALRFLLPRWCIINRAPRTWSRMHGLCLVARVQYWFAVELRRGRNLQILLVFHSSLAGIRLYMYSYVPPIPIWFDNFLRLI